MLMMLLFLLTVAVALIAILAGLMWLRDRLNVDRLPKKWETATNAGRGLELGLAQSARITVLFDWLVGDGKYIGDAGVSYLADVDGRKILFDLGDSYGKKNPSPVLDNMQRAGLDPQKLAGELAAVVISHHHRDHVGGFGAQLRGTYRLPGSMRPDCPIYLPKPLKHPTLEGRVLPAPQQIIPGVAVTGPLPGWMFTLGDTPEQMMIINRPEGLVMVLGCGHPGAVPMVRYARQIAGRPVFALFGGVHALLDQSRTLLQRIVATKNPPWRPVTPEDIGIMAVGLLDLGVKKLYLSAHDSDDWALSIIEGVYGKDLVMLRVGETYKF